RMRRRRVHRHRAVDGFWRQLAKRIHVGRLLGSSGARNTLVAVTRCAVLLEAADRPGRGLCRRGDGGQKEGKEDGAEHEESRGHEVTFRAKSGALSYVRKTTHGRTVLVCHLVTGWRKPKMTYAYTGLGTPRTRAGRKVQRLTASRAG